MAAAHEYSTEELNYFRICNVTTRIIAEGLRVVFKLLWDTHYQATHGPWQDTATNGIDLYSMESSKSRKRNSRELLILRNGNRLEWDCTSLFVAILYSDSIGKGLDPVVKKAVDDLRRFRNKVFAHLSDGKLREMDFETSIQKVIDDFIALKLDTADIEAIKNQKTFPTEELRLTQQQLEKEKKRNEEPRSFCVLPPKPSHEVIDRSSEVDVILQKMKELRSTKINEITVVYLSGNPGCGKSEIARQIGERVFDDVPDNATDQVKFVFALNASSTDTLIQSYIGFAITLNCDEKSTTSIGTSKDLSPEDKLIHLKTLVAPKLRKYSSWLLIVDNVTDVKSVFRFLPKAREKTEGNGQILFTTQDSRSIGANNSYTYHLSLSRGMKPDEAVKILFEISGVASNKECILRVAKALDFQPLALACAATYMKRVSDVTSMSWEEYLQKIQQGKREATEGEYKRISVTYPQSMTAAVKLSLEKEMAANMVMMHAFQFLSALGPQRIPLEYVVQYVTRCMTGHDEDLVAATVFSSSLILNYFEDQSKEIGIHQVVHSCLQDIVLHKSKKEEFHFLVNVINAFSALLNAFDGDNVNHIKTTKFVVVHFMHFSKHLTNFTTESLSPIKQKTNFEQKQNEYVSYFSAAGDVCQTHAKHEAAITLFKTVLMIKEFYHHCNHPTLAPTLTNLGLTLCSLGKHEEAQKYLKRALTIQENAHDKNLPTLATALNNLGTNLSHLSKYDEAQKYLKRALAIQEMEYGQNHPKLATTLSNLGSDLRTLGKHEKAQKCLERALTIQDIEYDQDHPKLAPTLNNLGSNLIDLGKYEEAQKCLERALAIDEKAYGQNHPKLATTLNNLGTNLIHLGKYEEAQKCLERALTIQEKAYDQNHPTLAPILSTLGSNLHDLGKHEEAQKRLKRALTIQEMAYGQNHPNLVTTLSNLGSDLRTLGKHEEAQKCFDRALTIQEMAYDQNHPALASTLNNLGSGLIDLGKHKEAQKCLERALAIEEMAYNQNHPQLATTLNNLGSSLHELGKLEEAQKCYERALTIQEMAYDQTNPTLAPTLNNLGSNLIGLGKHEEAQKHLERALTIQEKAYDQNHPALATTLNNLGSNLIFLGKHEEAQKCLKRALTIGEMAYGQNHPKLATTLNYLGLNLHRLSKDEEAQKCYERALTIQEKAYDKNHPTLAPILYSLGLHLRKLGKHEEAQKCLERLLTIQEMAYDQNHPTLATILITLGSNLHDLGKHEEAQQCLKRALTIQEMAYGQNHPTLATTLIHLALMLSDLGKDEEAQNCFDRASTIQEMAYDQNHPTLALH